MTLKNRVIQWIHVRKMKDKIKWWTINYKVDKIFFLSEESNCIFLLLVFHFIETFLVTHNLRFGFFVIIKDPILEYIIFSLLEMIMTLYFIIKHGNKK